MQKIRVLFVCVHNSARSQMAEAILKHYGGERFFVESGGIEDGKLNPYVVEVMAEIGIDISENISKSVFSLYKAGRIYDYLISCCDEAAGEKCPIFPGIVERINWSFEDPSLFKGNEEEILKQTRIVRNQIKNKILKWIEERNFDLKNKEK